MTRKTMRLSEIRALTNRYLAGSGPELADFRRGVSSMYEHLAMAANDYHGYNDLVLVWADPDSHEGYVPDETYRREYFGDVSGPDAEPAQRFIDIYRALGDAELSRRRNEAVALAGRLAKPTEADEDKAWRDAYYIADVGASNPQGVQHTLDELVNERHVPSDHPAVRAIRGHLSYLQGRGLGPELDDLREVQANAKRLGLTHEDGSYCNGCGCREEATS